MNRKWMLALGALVAGCMSLFPHTAGYKGRKLPPLVDASQVRERATIPGDFDVLGTAEAVCEDVDSPEASDTLVLGDVSCTQGKLTDALFAKAAEVGGVIIAEKECEEEKKDEKKTKEKDGKTSGYTVTTTRITCRAQVARPNPDALAANKSPPTKAANSAPAPRPSGEPREPKIKVRVTRRSDAGLRPSIDVADVAELAEVPSNHELIAHVVARCFGPCSEDKTRDALRQGAAAAGARVVTGVECKPQPDGWLCSADSHAPLAPAAAPDADASTNEGA